MIVKQTPAFVVLYCAALMATPHLHEGKLGKLDNDGKLCLATSAADAFGVISEPDSALAAQAGGATGATLIHRKFAGVLTVQLGNTAAVKPGTPLTFGEGAVFVAAQEGDTVLAYAAETAAPNTPGQMVAAVLA